MENPRILVAIPYSYKKQYCLAQTFEAAQHLTYPNKEIVLRFDPNPYGSKDACKKQREFFRLMAIEKGFDYLYFLGCDTIPPDDVIERLLAHGKHISGGVYWGRAHAENGNTNSPVAWIHDITPPERNSKCLSGDVITVDGMGMDCVLFSREVLEKISFLSWEQNDDDYPFYDKAKALGYKVYLDTTIQCRHYYGEDFCEGFSYMATDNLI